MATSIGQRAVRRASAAVALLAAVLAGWTSVAAARPAGGAASTAATITLAPSADSYVSAKSPSANYGTLAKLKAEGSPLLVSYLRFDVSGLSGGVAQATLRLYATSKSSAGFSVRAVDPSASWTETGITYRNAPAYGGGLGSSGPVVSGRWYAVDVTPSVSGNGTVNLAVVSSATTVLAMNSREAAAATRPQLVVTPASASAQAPANTAAPTLSGTAQDGQELTADPGTWTGTAPIAYAYQWQGCDAAGAGCADLAGETGQTLALGPAQVGGTVRVVVTATNTAGSAPATSAPNVVVAAKPLPPSVLFGGNAPVGQSHETSVQALETKAGRKMAIVRVYDRWDQAFPTSDDLWLASTNHPIVLSVKARRLDGSYITFADIAAAAPGSPLYDDIVAWADEVKQFPEHVWFTFNPEPESANSQASGGAADYVAAWRNVVSIFRAEGVTNADYLWNATAFGLGNGSSAAYYPGDEWVDAIGADGYNSYGCKAGAWRSFADVFAGLRSFASAHPGKTVMIPEWGSTEDPAQPGRKAQWIADMEGTLETPAWSSVGAVLVWSSTVAGTNGTCDYRVDTSQSALDAWKMMGVDAYFGRFAP